MSKTKTLFIILTVLLLLIIGTTLAIVLTPQNNTLDVIVDTQSGVMHLNASAASISDTEGYPKVEVNATVTGIDVYTLDWSLKWEDESNQANVSDFVVLTSSGNTATLECIAKFNTNMILHCVSSHGNATASCVVRYAGRPTDMFLSQSTEPTAILFANQEYGDCFVSDKDLSQDEWDHTLTNGKFYDFGDIRTVYFDLTYSNIFGEITDEKYINQNYEIEIKGYGSCKVCAYDPERGEFYTNQGIVNSYVGLDPANDMLTCSIEDGKLKIVRQNMTDYVFMGYIPGSNTHCEYRYVEGNSFYYGITVKAEGLNGIMQTETIFIRPIMPPGVITLDTDEIAL